MADRGIADESLQFCAFERTRQDFALREAAQGRRVADGSAKFNTDLECLQIGGGLDGASRQGALAQPSRARGTLAAPAGASPHPPPPPTSISPPPPPSPS